VNLAVDSSALLAILLAEPDGDEYLDKLLGADVIWISPVNWWEVQVKIRIAQGDAGLIVATGLMTKVGIVIEPILALHAELAFAARIRYGGRPARLNMGDCFAYALARAKNAPLLYKGGDFSQTDLKPA
jgi:ribonuclease VapC